MASRTGERKTHRVSDRNPTDLSSDPPRTHERMMMSFSCPWNPYISHISACQDEGEAVTHIDGVERQLGKDLNPKSIPKVLLELPDLTLVRRDDTNPVVKVDLGVVA